VQSRLHGAAARLLKCEAKGASQNRMSWLKGLVLCGLAAEHCIMASKLQALKQGYDVLLLTDAIASYKPGARAEVFRSLSAQGAQLHTQSTLSISAE
jgi:nicotinamidase-related amidase